MQFFDEGRARGAKHIVVDPRRTATAARGDLHLQPVAGTDLALANGMLNVVAREGLIDEDYVAERTNGFERSAGPCAFTGRTGWNGSPVCPRTTSSPRRGSWPRLIAR